MPATANDPSAQTTSRGLSRAQKMIVAVILVAVVVVGGGRVLATVRYQWHLVEDAMLDFDAAAQKAAKLLGCTPADAWMHSEVLPDSRGFRFWVPTRGGGAVLMGPYGDLLFANSSLSDDEHLSRFLAGQRTPEALFTQDEYPSIE